MAKKGQETTVWARLNVRVTQDTVSDVETVLAALKRQEVYCSVSMFIEIAMKELLKRRDLADVMEKHKATARRD